jgi:hypothetical protein
MRKMRDEKSHGTVCLNYGWLKVVKYKAAE